MMKAEQIVKMYAALERIAKGYQTPDQLRKNSDKEWGLGYEETLEMAYENLQAEAKAAIKGVRIKPLVDELRTKQQTKHQKEG